MTYLSISLIIIYFIIQFFLYFFVNKAIEVLKLCKINSNIINFIDNIGWFGYLIFTIISIIIIIIKDIKIKSNRYKEIINIIFLFIIIGIFISNVFFIFAPFVYIDNSISDGKTRYIIVPNLK